MDERERDDGEREEEGVEGQNTVGKERGGLEGRQKERKIERGMGKVEQNAVKE